MDGGLQASSSLLAASHPVPADTPACNWAVISVNVISFTLYCAQYSCIATGSQRDHKEWVAAKPTVHASGERDTTTCPQAQHTGSSHGLVQPRCVCHLTRQWDPKKMCPNLVCTTLLLLHKHLATACTATQARTPSEKPHQPNHQPPPHPKIGASNGPASNSKIGLLQLRLWLALSPPTNPTSPHCFINSASAPLQRMGP